MATASSLISKIHSAMSAAASFYELPPSHELVIALGNLNVFLICSRNTGDDDDTQVIMKSLFSRIENALARIPTHDSALINKLVGVNAQIMSELRHSISTREVVCLAVEAINGPWCANTMPNRLTLDDVIEVADSILHSITVFWRLVEVIFWGGNHSNQALVLDLHDEMDGFEVQARFLRDFLLFARRAGVGVQQMRNLLAHVRPFALDATIVFQIDTVPFSCQGVAWLKRVKSKAPMVDPQVFEAYIQTLVKMQTLDQADDGLLKDFLGSLVSLLWHVLRHGRRHRHFDSLKALYGALRLSRSSLKQQCWPDNDFRHQAGVLIRDAGILICSLYLAEVDSSYLSGFLRRFGVLQAQMLPPESSSLRANVLNFGEPSKMEDISNASSQIETAVASHQSSNTPQDVGFQEDEVNLIMDRLTRGSKQLHFVPISGMAGLGKTTFALKAYNHHSIMYHFQARAWCTISQVLNKKRVLFQLLNQIQPGVYSRMDEDDLPNKLRQSLKQKRYLIFLDDVWTVQVWESLSPSFPNDGTQSRILLTSRLHAIAPTSDPPHFLRLREESECLEIIEMKLR